MQKVFQEYVVGFLFRKVENKTEVALIQKNRPEWQKGKFNGIGGKIEKNESPDKAITREFWEETGATGVDWHGFGKLTWAEGVVWLFKASNDTIALKSTTDEQVSWHSIDKLPNVVPNIHWIIPVALTGNLGYITAEYL